MAKAIFLDIDGTLLSFETHSVPCSTIKVLKEAGSLGYKIIIATGRASKNIQEIAEVPYDAVIALNGKRRNNCFTKANFQCRLLKSIGSFREVSFSNGFGIE